MKKQRSPKVLRLKTETVRALADRQLETVAGGHPNCTKLYLASCDIVNQVSGNATC